MVKVVANHANAKVGFKIKHGPDGQSYILHTSIASATVPAEKLYAFDSGAGMIGEWIQGVPVGGGSNLGEWAILEVYEMRKPF